MTVQDEASQGRPADAGSGAPASAPAGWYPEPGAPGSLRYWDGARWTEHRAPAQAPLYVQAPMYVQYPSQVAAVRVVAASDPVTRRADGQLSFAGHRICSPGERLGAYLLDGLLMLVTLYIGWLIWACITASEGQTPGKRLLGQRVYRLETGQPATFGWMLGMRGCVGGMVFGMSFYVLVGFVLMFMPFWDRRNQTVVDKISSTVVVAEGR